MKTNKIEPKEWFQGLVDKYKDDAEYIAEGLLIDVTEQILEKLQSKEMSRTDLAKKLNCSNPYITKLLNGSQNLTLKKLVEIAQVLECTVDFAFVSKDFNVKRHFTFASKKVIKEGFNEEVQLLENYESNISNAA